MSSPRGRSRLRLARSTKAGAETPATPPGGDAYTSQVSAAQRRPGPRPRRHRPGGRYTGSVSCRSTKAGAETPATRTSTCAIRIYVPPRSTKAGAETPATHLTAVDPDALAQRRPGPRPRRHSRQSTHRAKPFDPRRSTKAGAETPATRGRPAVTVCRERHARSTKAGAETPATLLIGAEHLHGRNSVPDLPTPDSDFDHLFGLCLGMDVVTDPQMPPKPAQVTTLSQAALESPGVRRSSVRAPKARRARASQSGQTGSELRKCHS